MKLDELRRNPEKNPKRYTDDILMKKLHEGGYFVHFTDVQKLGMNPQYRYPTLFGIHCYPVENLYDPHEKEFDIIHRFGTSRKYFFTFRVDNTNVIDLAQYGNHDWENDLKKLEPYIERLTRFQKDDFRIYQATLEKVGYSFPERLIKTVGFLANHLPDRRKEVSYNRISINTTFLLLKLGYTGFVDSGKDGYIAKDIPGQAVFFTTKIIKDVEFHRNVMKRNPQKY